MQDRVHTPDRRAPAAPFWRRRRALAELPFVPRLEPGVRPFLFGLAVVSIVCAGSFALRDWMSVADVTALLLLAVLWLSVAFGPWPSQLTAMLAAMACNFLFIEPYYTFRLEGTHEYVTFAVFVLSAATMTYWTTKARRQSAELTRIARMAEQRRTEAQVLQRLANQLSGRTTLSELVAAGVDATWTLGVTTLVLASVDEDGVALLASNGPAAAFDRAERQAAWAAYRHGIPTGHQTLVEPGSVLQFHPLHGMDDKRLVLGIRIDAHDGTEISEGLLSALGDQIAVALQRAQLSARMNEARLFAETEKLRSALLNSITHDFRTPLASIIGAASSLTDPQAHFTEDGRRRLLDTILESGQRLHRYIGNLLDMSRLEAGVLHLNCDWVDVADLVGTAVSHAEFNCAERRIALDLPPGLPLVHVDFVLMEQAFINLLDNAAKYSPAGSTVTVSARDEGAVVAIRFSNTGPMRALTEYEAMFEPFQRTGAPPDDSGLGLGLSICRGFVDAHGGTISAGPGADGTGTTVSIRLPVEEAGRRAMTEAAADD
ncbi:MAG: DUF4118 domain-containing protein [Alphaproteobacteria bacterium]|nr:DUF4118 domain-containing protein [Alphaproteobacteria bacterium]